MSEPTEYKGETKARNPKLATALSFVAPGLGLVYVGETVRGVLANLGFIVLLEAFVIVFASVKFFPLLPGVVLALVWLTYVAFAARAARRAIRAEDYLLKPTNHPLIYAVIALLTFIGPVLATAQFTTARLVSIVPVQDAGMIPTLRPGDFALVDRTTYQKRLPHG
ncbi:MAG: hypothetical protein R3E66_16795 [bacterium]